MSLEAFHKQNKEDIRKLGEDRDLKKRSLDWLAEVSQERYSYHFTWLGLPIIQFPQDMVAMQEILWQVKPDLVIETGIAHGGSLILYASILELIGEGHVLGVDVEIREHNKKAIEAHPLFKRITMIEGSSTDPAVVGQVENFARDRKKILVVLDSNHTHEHVAGELAAYAPLVSLGSYLVVFDTIIEDLPADFFPDRSWGPGHNPKTAVREFLKTTDRFVVDREIEDKLMITVAPGGYLKCVK
ncbi:MAG: cephalosporin hydroxylase family protein [Proteobacteria bacterium]|nr:cephalosporin hydroxylase family protein [Pseudomonadota bacterium]